jgi:putative transcriptional regulator
LTFDLEPGIIAPMPAYQSRVREYRVKAGFTQEELARQLGVSRQTVVNIERGLNEPKVLLAIALGGLLGVALAELFRKGVPRSV